MGIGAATQMGQLVVVYDEKGLQLFSQSGELKGYTSSTVSIKLGKTITTYDQKGWPKFSSYSE